MAITIGHKYTHADQRTVSLIKLMRPPIASNDMQWNCMASLMDTDNNHQFEISVGQLTLPALAATRDLREGQDVDRHTVLGLLGGGCGPDPLAVPVTPRLRMAEVRHLF